MSTQFTFNILGLWMIKCLHYSNNKCLKIYYYIKKEENG